MEAYSYPKDIRETDSFPFDWSDRLGSGETISAMSVTMVQAAGLTTVTTSFTTTVTRVFFSAGTAGLTAVWLVTVTTNGSRTLDQDFSVEVVDKAIVEAAETDIARLTRQIAEAKAQRQNIALGEAVVEVMRDGRRVVRKLATMAELENYIRVLESELAAAQVDAGVTPTRQRRAISIGYRN